MPTIKTFLKTTYEIPSRCCSLISSDVLCSYNTTVLLHYPVSTHGYPSKLPSTHSRGVGSPGTHCRHALGDKARATAAPFPPIVPRCCGAVFFDNVSVGRPWSGLLDRGGDRGRAEAVRERRGQRNPRETFPGTSGMTV